MSSKSGRALKVLHLSTADRRGGAAAAAFRLHEAMAAAGHDSRMLVRDRIGADSSIATAQPRPELAIIENVGQQDLIQEERVGEWNTHFSLACASCEVAVHEWVKRADVLHLHWVVGLADPVELQRILRLGKKVVWTLHDQRPFTGGCHFSYGCRGFEMACGDCPQLNEISRWLPPVQLRDQHTAWDNRVQVVTPSHWLADCARDSSLMKDAEIHVIPYGVPGEIFSPVPDARKTWDLPADSQILLFGAASLDERRKGFLELQRALEEASGELAKLNCTLVTFGSATNENFEFSIPAIHLGAIHDPAKLAALYSAADLFLLPVLEDNLPNTLLESMACGTPALAFRVGGIPDVIDDESTGFLCDPGSSDDFAKRLVKILQQPEKLRAMRKSSTRRIVDHFSLKLQVERYVDLYAACHPVERVGEVSGNEDFLLKVSACTLKKHDQKVGAFREVIAEKERFIQNQEGIVNELEAELETRLAAINQKESEIHVLADALEKARKHIDFLESRPTVDILKERVFGKK